MQFATVRQVIASTTLMSVSCTAKLTQRAGVHPISGVHPMGRNYVTFLRLESPILCDVGAPNASTLTNNKNIGALRAVHHLRAIYRFDVAHVCQQTFPINAMPMEFFPSGVHPLFRNYVTCLRLESQVLVILELPMHPHLAATDCKRTPCNKTSLCYTWATKFL